MKLECNNKLENIKILHVGHSLMPGGITSFIKSIISLNSHCSSQHDFLTLNNFDHPPELGGQSYALNKRSRSIVKQFKFLWVLQKNYNAVFMHAIHPIAILPFVVSRKQVFLFQHGMTVHHGSKLKRTIKRLWYSLVPNLLNSRVICSTQFARQKLKKNGIYIRPKRIDIVPFGVALQKKPEFVQITETPPLKLGMAGRLVGQKRFDLVLSLLARCELTNPVELYIAGEGPEKQQLARLSSKLDDTRVTVRFLGQVKDMSVFYESVDLFILPSIAESQGLVVSEALLYRRPVLVFSDVGGCLEFITPGKNGYILHKQQDFIALINRLTINKAELLAMQNAIKSMDGSRLDMAYTRTLLEKLVCS